jgi:predicted phage terminase large subunit-like protein
VPENILQQAQFTFKIGSWDTAFKVDSKDGDASDPDFSVYTLWGVNQQGFFLLDRYKEKLEYPDLLNAALNLYNRDRPNALLIEDKASGQSLIQSLRSCGMPVPIVPIKPIGTKIDRAYQAVPFFSAGMVHFPAGAYWLHDYIETLVGFPDAAHDDDVDSTSQAIIWYSQGGISGGGKQIMQAIEDDYCI